MAGRKKKYKKKFCESLIEHMGEGFAYTTWGSRQDPTIGKTIMYEWEEAYPEWKEAKEVGYQKGLDFYEKLLVSKIIGITPEKLKLKSSRGVDGISLQFVLRTRFCKEYGDKQQVDHKVSDGSINVNFVKNKNKDIKGE